MSVWVLVFLGCGYRECSPAIIDNISTAQECKRVASIIKESDYTRIVRCIEVRKNEMPKTIEQLKFVKEV